MIDTEIQPEGRIAKNGPNLPMKRAGTADEVRDRDPLSPVGRGVLMSPARCSASPAGR